MDANQLRQLIIEPVCDHLGLKSPVATNLLLGTCAQESHMGAYIKQVGAGPALGIYQMEPATHDDLWKNFLAYKPALATLVKDYSLKQADSQQLVGNLFYATAMIRVHYYRIPAALPGDPANIAALAHYWKLYYNTPLGAGTEAEFIANYKKYVA